MISAITLLAFWSPFFYISYSALISNEPHKISLGLMLLFYIAYVFIKVLEAEGTNSEKR